MMNRRIRNVVGAATSLAVVCIVSSVGAQGIGYKVLEKDPDHDNVYVAGSLYYAMIASNMFNVGAHAQATVVLAPALEVQGSMMANIPGSNIGMFHVEGSGFIGIPWMSKGRVNLSSYTQGQYTVTEFVEVPDIERSKFGLDGGLYFDTHGVKVYDRDDDPRQVRGFGGFAGLKWVYQNKSTTMIQGYGTYTKHNRFSYYVHVIRSLTMGYGEDAGREAPKEAPIGGRFGMEGKFNGDTAFFLKYEAGAMPSVRGPDWNMFVFLGVSHSRKLF